MKLGFESIKQTMTKYDERGCSQDDTFIKLFNILNRSSPLGSMKHEIAHVLVFMLRRLTKKFYLFDCNVVMIDKDISPI